MFSTENTKKDKENKTLLASHQKWITEINILSVFYWYIYVSVRISLSCKEWRPEKYCLRQDKTLTYFSHTKENPEVESPSWYVGVIKSSGIQAPSHSDIPEGVAVVLMI